jgi:hypothetical protein
MTCCDSEKLTLEAFHRTVVSSSGIPAIQVRDSENSMHSEAPPSIFDTEVGHDLHGIRMSAWTSLDFSLYCPIHSFHRIEYLESEDSDMSFVQTVKTISSDLTQVRETQATNPLIKRAVLKPQSKN